MNEKHTLKSITESLRNGPATQAETRWLMDQLRTTKRKLTSARKTIARTQHANGLLSDTLVRMRKRG